MSDGGPIAALVLAAGQSRRMGRSKQLLPWRGLPLVRHAAMAALDGGAQPVIAVLAAALPPQADTVEQALDGLPLTVARLAATAPVALSASLKAGLALVPPDSAGVLVLLADMPLVDAALVARLIAAFRAHGGDAIIQPEHAGQRGNPVLWPRRLLGDLASIDGDQGGRAVLARNADAVRPIPADSGVLRDIDTPEAYQALLAGN